MIRAYKDAFSAVYAALIDNPGLSVSDTNGLCRAALDAVGAAFAFCLVQCNGMIILSQIPPPSSN
jgi:hypothetical protein